MHFSSMLSVIALLAFHFALGFCISRTGCGLWCKGGNIQVATNGEVVRKEEEIIVTVVKSSEKQRKKKKKVKKLKTKSLSYMMKCFVVSIFDPTVNGKIDISHNNTVTLNIGNNGGVMFTNAAAAPSYGPVCGPNGCF